MAYTGFYVFGDSLVDAGNALKLAQWYGGLPLTDLPEGAPTAEEGYFAGRFSDGFTFADLVANKQIGVTTSPIFPYAFEDPWLGVRIAPLASDPAANNLNFAYGGAQIRQGAEVVPDLDGQTDAFRDAVDGRADSGALYLITMGGNDVRSLVPDEGAFAPQTLATSTLRSAAREMREEIDQLIDIGVRHIVVTGIPDVGLIPAYDANGDGVLTGDELSRSRQATLYSEQLDTLLQSELARLRTENPDVDIVYVSFTEATDRNLALLEALYGRPIDLTAEPETLFFDQIHPNAQAHALFAAAIIDTINGVTGNDRLPLTAPDYSAGGTIAARGEIDHIVVSLAANTTYTFEMLGISSLGAAGSLADPALRVFAPGGLQVGSNDDGGLGLDATFTFTTGAAGDYLIDLAAVGSLTGAYSFRADGNSAGDTLYSVSHGNALILERPGEGADTVRASVNFVLGAGVSIETLATAADAGTVAINLTGNELAQMIVGNAARNILRGLAGNDTLSGLAGNDTLDGGAGNDLIDGGSGADLVSYAAASSSVTVNLGIAGAQNTRGAGTDTLVGIENLTGSNFNDALTGSSAANVVNGGRGNDSIGGGAGNDTLIGGVGADSFRFDTALSASANVDTLSDFSAADDTILLSTAIFTGIAAGTLSAAAFQLGTAANDAGDRIVYDQATGRIYYDADGNGAGAQTLFARVAVGTVMSNLDFVGQAITAETPKTAAMPLAVESPWRSTLDLGDPRGQSECIGPQHHSDYFFV